MLAHKYEPTIQTSIETVWRERAARPYFLDQISGEGAPQRLVLQGNELVIGRGEDAQVRLLSRRASRHHALLVRQGLDYHIRDLDSDNGIYLNTIRVHSALLHDGDHIQIADCAFVYLEG